MAQLITPCPLFIALMPLKCYSNLQFPHLGCTLPRRKALVPVPFQNGLFVTTLTMLLPSISSGSTTDFLKLRGIFVIFVKSFAKGRLTETKSLECFLLGICPGFKCSNVHAGAKWFDLDDCCKISLKKQQLKNPLFENWQKYARIGMRFPCFGLMLACPWGDPCLCSQT